MLLPLSAARVIKIKTKKQVSIRLSLFHLPTIPVWGLPNLCRSNSHRILEMHKQVLDPVTSRLLWPLCKLPLYNHPTRKRLKNVLLPSIRLDHPLLTSLRSHRPNKEIKTKSEAQVPRMWSLHKELGSNQNVVQVRKHHLCHKVSILRKLVTNWTKVDTQRHRSSNEGATHHKSKPKSQLHSSLIVEAAPPIKMNWKTNRATTKSMIRSRMLLPFFSTSSSYKQESNKTKGRSNSLNTIISWVIIIPRLARRLTLPRGLINCTRLRTDTQLRHLELCLHLESNPTTNQATERPQLNYSTNLRHN